MRLKAAARLKRRNLPLLAGLCLLASACSPDTFLALDESRERNLQRAQNAESIKQYDTAAKYYLLALEKNSHSAIAHLGYAAICEHHLSRYADAVYHYQQFLQLQPKDPKADDIRRRITNCLERLASSVPVALRSETIARELDASRRENLQLRGQVSNLVLNATVLTNEVQRLNQALAEQTAALAQAQSQVQAQLTQLSRQANTAPVPAPHADPSPRNNARVATDTAPRTLDRSSSTSRTPSTSTPAPRGTVTYRVASGDTMAKIARRYGVSLADLQSANPGLNPRQLKPGSLVRIPAR